MAKDNNNEIQQNKDNMLSMIAITEDITRTTTRLHQVLYNLMSNPGDVGDIKNSIDDLSNKINTLKDVTIGTPLIGEEETMVPDMNDASPLEDINYKPPVVEERNLAKMPETKKSSPPKPSRKPRKTSKNLSTRPPKKPLSDKKRVPRTPVAADVDDTTKEGQ